MTDLEQRCLMSGELPSIEEYQARRMGSGAVGVCLALTEYVLSCEERDFELTLERYCFGMAISPSIMQSKEMKALWDDTNLIICV